VILKELREEKGLSQQKLGELLGFDQKTISNYEVGRTEPGIKTIKKFCRFFGVTADEFLEMDKDD